MPAAGKARSSLGRRSVTDSPVTLDTDWTLDDGIGIGGRGVGRTTGGCGLFITTSNNTKQGSSVCKTFVPSANPIRHCVRSPVHHGSRLPLALIQTITQVWEAGANL